jgi:hypothetical protein
MTLRNKVLAVLGCLGLLFVFLSTTTFTIDLGYRINTVVLLSACRVVLLAGGLFFLWTVRASWIDDLDVLSVTLIAIILTGALSGLFGQWAWIGYLRHGFQYLFMLTFYLIGRHLARSYDVKEWQIRVTCIAILIGYTAGAILYALTPGLHSGLYSLQPNLLLLPLAYNHSPLMSAVSGLLIIVGNKRAVFIGACFCVAVLVVLTVGKRRRISLPLQVASILALTPAIIVALTLALSATSVPLFDMVANRLSIPASVVNTATNESLVASDGKVHLPGTTTREANLQKAPPSLLTKLTSTRDIEVAAVWSLLRSDPLSILVGAGLGSTFQMNADYQRSQADILPAHLAMTSGIPLSILFTVALMSRYWRMFLRLNLLGPTDKTLVLFVLSLTLDIMFGFNATNPVIWASMGYALARS